MKWSEFKELIEEAGVTGEMEMCYADILGCEDICDLDVEITKDGTGFSVS
ncbi:MAG: hypothetical protein KAS32_11600 [Candidatus Peribacteraceae bacterium]|nr:hypothetical protein [Candidatus Peribacteraceae bacterium]